MRNIEPHWTPSMPRVTNDHRGAADGETQSLAKLRIPGRITGQDALSARFSTVPSMTLIVAFCARLK